MKLNPQQAPLYGECVLTVQLCDEEVCEEEEDVEFYLLFSGSTQTHLSSTVRTSHVTLQAICPAHACCETVRVTLCSAGPGRPAGPVGPGERFRFVQDLAFDMAQFLVSAAGRSDGLEAAMLLDQCDIPLQECERLDRGLARALRHLPLPPGWSLLGPHTDTGAGGNPAPHETLLHFAARRGFRRVAVFLLKQPGGRQALGLPNKQGATPAAVAKLRGHSQLQQILSQEDGGLVSNTKVPWEMCLGDRVVRHHPKLNTYTLTVATAPGRPPPNLQGEVEELRRLIGCHKQSQVAQGSPGPETETGSVRARLRSPGACGAHETGSAVAHGSDAGWAGGSRRGDYEAPEEEEEEERAGSAAAWGEGDREGEAESGRVARRRRTKEQRSSLCDRQEPRAPRRAFNALRQEGESCAGREGEREEGGERGRTERPPVTDMGLAQSQEHPEPEGYSEAEEASESEREEEGENRRTAAALSPDEGGNAEGEEDREREDAYHAMQQLFTPTLLGDARARCAERIDGVRAPEPAPPTTDGEESKPETEGSQQSKETAAGDGGNEGGGERGTEWGRDGGGGPVGELAPGGAETETGNRGERDNDIAESPCGAKGKPPQPESTGETIGQLRAQIQKTEDGLSLSDIQMERTEEEFGQSDPERGRTEEHCRQSEPMMEIAEKYLGQSDLLAARIEECLSQSDPLKESSEVYLGQSGRRELDAAAGVTNPVHNPPSLPVLTVDEGKPADEMVQTMEHTKWQQLPLPGCDITSCSSDTEAGGEKGIHGAEGGVCDVCAEAANVLSGSMAEASHVPENSRKMSFKQEVHPLEEEDEGMRLANDGTLSSVGCHWPSTGLSMDSDVWREEDRSEEKAVTSLSIQHHPEILSNQDTADRGSGPNQDDPEAELASEVVEIVGTGKTEGIQVYSDSQIEGATLGSEVIERDTGGIVVHSESQIEETTLGSQVTETVIGGSDVQSDSCTDKTTLGSEVMETVTGGSDVQSDSQIEETTLRSEVTETSTSRSELHSDTSSEEITVGSEVTDTDTVESDVHSDSCMEETTSEKEMYTQALEIAATSDPEVVSLNNVSSGIMGCPTEGDEPVRDITVTMNREPQEELECVVNKHTTPQVTSQDHAASESSSETANPDCFCTGVGHVPSLDPTLELGKEKEVCEDVEERKKKTSEETHTMPATEDISMVNQEDSREGSSSDLGADAGDEEIHRENDSYCPSQLCAALPQEEKQSSEPPESCPRLTPLSTGSSSSAARRDSGSGADGFFTAGTEEYSAFPKVEVELMTGDSTSEVSVSCSSNEDAASLGPPGSAPDCSAGGRRSWSSEEVQRPDTAGAGEEEEKDRLTEVPARSSLLRCPARSPSPFRRHSWGPAKTHEGEAETGQRSSLGSLAKRIPTFQRRSYSLEGLNTDSVGMKDYLRQRVLAPDPGLAPRPKSRERGSVVSLTEEDLGSDLGERSNSLGRQISAVFRSKRRLHGSMTLPLTKSVSLLAINQRDLDGMRSFSSVSGSLAQSISEEAPGPLRAGEEGKSGTKVGRTFSYLRSKMYKKTKEKEKEKNRGKEKEKEVKERDKRVLNGHLFNAASSAPFVQCQQCHKVITTKEAFNCTNCNAHVHKPCREALPVCTKTKMKLLKQQVAVPDSSILRSKSTALPERPWAVRTENEGGPRRHSGIRPFSSSNLSKSISISNIAGPVLEEIPLKGLRYLSQSTDSLNNTSKANESTESLTDEGTEMMDSQLMGEFEAEAKELEAESWTFTVDKKYLKPLRKDSIKRQDVIYELMQTEMHHVRTLRMVSEVYSKGLLKEVQLEAQTVERVFPALDELLEIHSGFLASLLDRRRESRLESGDSGNFLIREIGDVLAAQFSGSSAERMKKVYGKFCSCHKEALSFYKELHAKDKRFQAFVKRKMSCPVVRRLGIPECILLVTQRITKYPVLLQRLLQHTKEGEEDFAAVTQALGLVREVIGAVDGRVNEQEQKQRLREVYRRTDSRSVMRMQSGQMFAREDLLRGRRLLHHGALQLKSSAGRLKDVQALLLSDVFVFLQEKDQKYVFATLDQRSTVLSLQKLIVREVANEERGLFLIAAGVVPEMVEVHASSREERNTWIQLIQRAAGSMEKDEDEGIPSESEEDKRVLETKAKEMRDQLRRKEQQIAALLEEKLKVFHDTGSDSGPGGGALFRALAEDTPAGELAMQDALREVENLQTLVSSGLVGAVEPVSSAGSVWGSCSSFDRNPINNISKNGEGDSPDLQRTESDSALKKGVNANLLLLLQKDSEVLHSVCRLHELLNSLQAVVVQQDSILEEQRNALSERPSSSPSSSSVWRSSSLVEQEKQRSLEKQRQEAAELQRQQEAHAAERCRREGEWEARERDLGGREARLLLLDEETRHGRGEVQREQQELRCLNEEYQRDLERLREAQRRLERDREQAQREQQEGPAGEKRSRRAPSSTSEDSLRIPSPVERRLSSSPIRDTLLRMGSMRKGKTLNPFASNPSHKAPAGEGQSHIPGRLLQLAKTKEPKEPKEKKEKKKKKKDKGPLPQPADSTLLPGPEQPVDGEILLC